MKDLETWKTILAFLEYRDIKSYLSLLYVSTIIYSCGIEALQKRQRVGIISFSFFILFYFTLFYSIFILFLFNPLAAIINEIL